MPRLTFFNTVLTIRHVVFPKDQDTGTPGHEMLFPKKSEQKSGCGSRNQGEKVISQK